MKSSAFSAFFFITLATTLVSGETLPIVYADEAEIIKLKRSSHADTIIDADSHSSHLFKKPKDLFTITEIRVRAALEHLPPNLSESAILSSINSCLITLSEKPLKFVLPNQNMEGSKTWISARGAKGEEFVIKYLNEVPYMILVRQDFGRFEQFDLKPE